MLGAEVVRFISHRLSARRNATPLVRMTLTTPRFPDCLREAIHPFARMRLAELTFRCILHRVFATVYRAVSRKRVLRAARFAAVNIIHAST